MQVTFLRPLCILALLLVAPGAKAQAPPAAKTQDSPAPPSAVSAVATVNGEPITAQEWVNRMQALTLNDFNASTRARRFTAGQLALDLLINDRLIMQYTAKVGLQPSPAELDAALALQKGQPAIKARLDNKTLTEAQLREAIRRQKALYNFITVNQTMADPEVRAYYDGNYGQKWQIALIRTASRDVAGKAYAALQKGAPFATVAAQYSEDATTKPFGGELRGPDGKARWFTAGDPTLPPFVMAAIRALKNQGDYSPILEERAGGGPPAFFILQMAGRYRASDEEYARVRDHMREEALFNKAIRSGQAEQKLAQVRKEARIVLHLPGYEPVSAPSDQK